MTIQEIQGNIKKLMNEGYKENNYTDFLLIVSNLLNDYNKYNECTEKTFRMTVEKTLTKLYHNVDNI